MGTWRVADVDLVIPVIQALNEVEWPQTRTAIRDFLGGFGWSTIADGLGMISNWGVTPGMVSLPTLNEQLTRVKFTACDAFPGEDLEAKAYFLQNAFVEYAGRFRKLWGDPTMTRLVPTPEMRWLLDSGCIIKLERARISLMLEFATPLGVSIDQIPDVRL